MTGSGVMPYLLRLEKNKLGLEHNVMTIAKQASGLDAILAISLTELGYGFIFADGEYVKIHDVIGHSLFPSPLTSI